MSSSAVLFSGGLDSAVLLALELFQGRQVQPIHVRAGLAWEEAEAHAIARLLARPPFDRGAAPLRTLVVDMRDVYPPTHWAVTGHPPAYDTPDEDVYLTGRNVMLLSKAAIYCAQHDIGRIALASLAGNPFPDATPEFFDAMARALSVGLAHQIRVDTPFSTMHKDAVVKIGVKLGVPLERTLSCMSPKDGLHCGRCSKCRERRDAFHEAGVEDRTRYAETPIR